MNGFETMITRSFERRENRKSQQIQKRGKWLEVQGWFGLQVRGSTSEQFISNLDMSTAMCLVELFILWGFDVTNAKNIISNILY